MTQKRRRVCTWFVEPWDAHTNEVIAIRLGEENALMSMVCSDRVRRDLWRCNWEIVSFLLKSSATLQIRFGVFCRQEPGGKIRKIPFLAS